jgi:glycine oxidase
VNVVIVGGGIMGMSVATELAGRGVDVTVLEKSVPGAEASSAAAGMLAPQLESTGPGPMLDLCLESRARYAAWARRIQELSGVDVGYRECGLLEIALDQTEHARFVATAQWQRAAGLRCEVLDGGATVRLEPALAGGRAIAGGLLLPDDHQIDPPKLMRALPIAAAKVGAKFRSGQVHGIVEKGGRAVGVDVDSDRLEADAVVVAAGSWSSLVAGARIDPRAVRPVRGQMVELHTRLPVTQRVLFGGGVYLVPRADGRLVAGSTMEHAGFDKRVTAAGLGRILNGAVALCPALEKAEVHATWAGLRPWTEDDLPILGEGPLPGLLLATGHFRNGILLAPITALLISQLLHAQATEVDMTPFRYARFPT